MSRTCVSIASCLALLAVVPLLGGASRSVAAEVQVVLRDGRTAQGEVDSRTDTERLWLRTEGARHQWTQSIPWLSVVEVRQAGQVLAREQIVAQATAPTRRLLWRSTEPASNSEPSTQVEPAAAWFDVQLPVRSVYVDAFAANWDADVAVDGLVVQFTAADRWGRPTAASGTLEIDLYGFRDLTRRYAASLDRFAHWSVGVAAEQFGPEGLFVELPYQGVQPEFDVAVAPRGLIRVRFSSPGSGVFEATATDVRLRPYSAFRDRLQQWTGSRFLPSESAGGTTRKRSSHAR
ncbi:MAG: hypothetical protein K1X74_18625 [Pirellulales bacterium]|nr:hypothetical protein [Pirellulales bacterium]